jgi:Fe-S-cluster containining protein
MRAVIISAAERTSAKSKIKKGFVKFMKIFSNWTVIPSLDTDLKKRHFCVIIREINLRCIEVNRKLCFCGSGKKTEDCHAEIAENTAMSYLFETFRLIDEDIKNAVATPQCPKGCNECCDYSFEVSAAEYFAILRHIQKNFTGFHTAALKKTALKVLPKFPAIADTSNHVGEKFAPCIFLDNRRGCRIYEVRPLICRLYGYYSAAGKCEKVSDNLIFMTDETYEHLDPFLSDITLENGLSIPPIAVPMVYWFGSDVLKRPGVKELFILAHEKTVDSYVKLSIHTDFNEWFAI